MKEQELLEKVKKMRMESGMSQRQLAKMLGVTREYINKVETGKKLLSRHLKELLEDLLLQYDSGYTPEILFDYCRIRFPTQDIRYVIEKVLRIRMCYMLHEEHGFYGYSEQYVFGDMSVMTSPDPKKGILLELKGRGCRQFERYLMTQRRNWYSFFREVKEEGGVLKRIDIAINDCIGILDIPWLIEKWKKKEYTSIFRSFDRHESGSEVVERDSKEKAMGNTFYCGSMKSEIYFCIYEKDYEQLVKRGVPLEEAEVKNRFEIRLKNERADMAINDLLQHENPGKTAFGIINHYLRVVEERDDRKATKDWKTDSKWQRFIGMEERDIKLTVKPEPYTFEKTIRWFARQVAAMWKAAVEIDEKNGTNVVGYILENTEYKERHKKLIEQQTLSVEEFVI